MPRRSLHHLIRLAYGSIAAATLLLAPTNVVAAVQGPATPAEIQAARELRPNQLRGASKQLPDLCIGVDDLQIDGGSSNENGLNLIQVAPPSLDIEKLEPGVTYRYCVFIYNTAPVARKYELSAVDLLGSADPDQQIDIVDPPLGPGSWIAPYRPVVTVPARSNAKVPYVIRVPETVPTGTAIAGVQVGNPENPAESGPGVDGAVIQHVYMTFGGVAARKLDIDKVEAPRFLSRSKDDITYRARFQVRNVGNTIEEYDTRLLVSAFGRDVAEEERGKAPLLPNAAHRVKMEWRGIPWIGLYHPKLVIDSTGGKQTVALPWLVILPPTPYVVAILLAIFVPLAYFMYRWRRRRKEWMAYLLEEMDREARDEGLDEDADDYWDPIRQP